MVAPPDRVFFTVTSTHKAVFDPNWVTSTVL